MTRTNLLALSMLFLVAGCAHEAAPSGGTTAQPATSDQVAMGAKLYADKCAMCHGDKGEGDAKIPAVVGKNALPLDPPPGHKRNVQFKTAKDVALWVKDNMPGDAPGSLSLDEYVAILAFDLKANGVDLTGKLPLTVDKLDAIVLH